MPKGSFTYYVIVCVRLVIEKKKTSPQFYRNKTEKQSHASRSNVQSLSSVGALVGDETVKIGAIQQVFHIFQETMILTILAGFLESNTTVTLKNIVLC